MQIAHFACDLGQYSVLATLQIFCHGNSLVADIQLLYGAGPQTLADKEILVSGVWNSRILKTPRPELIGRSMTLVC